MHLRHGRPQRRRSCRRNSLPVETGQERTLRPIAELDRRQGAPLGLVLPSGDGHRAALSFVVCLCSSGRLTSYVTQASNLVKDYLDVCNDLEQEPDEELVERMYAIHVSAGVVSPDND